MEDKRCKECGTVLLDNVKECPNCGCPAQEEMVIAKKIKDKKYIDVRFIISFILGVCIIVLGISVIKKEANIEIYEAMRYDANKLEFGADFYTEIYGATDIIVDELSDVNKGIEILSNSVIIIVKSIYYVGGMLMIAFGVGVIAMSILNMNKLRLQKKAEMID